MGGSLFARLVMGAAEALDRRFGWDRLPLPLGVFTLIGLRMRLRQDNLHDTSQLAAPAQASPVAPSQRYLSVRMPDGTYNDLRAPATGSAGTRFGRNIPLAYAYPEPEPDILIPNPRTVSRELLTRHTFIPATSLNLLAAAWLQFMVRDWFSHGKGLKENMWELPLQQDDPWPDRPMHIPRTRPDPTRLPGSSGPPTFINTETHWWDGSQIYGSSAEAQRMVRSGEHGKLRTGSDGGLPDQLLAALTAEPGGWLGLVLMYTLFVREHNAICDRLRAEYPSWSDEELFERARLINAALMAKIHTVEWTPAIISHPTTQFAMRGNWWGFQMELGHRVFGRLTTNDLISGAPGSETNHHAAPYSITEEFTAVYRMHPLIPDQFIFRTLDGDRLLLERTFREIAGHHIPDMLAQVPMADQLYSFGTSHPGAVVLHNFPRFLQEYERPDGRIIDLAATDILRIREVGVPRYNQFRRLLRLKPATSFAELTDNPAWAEEMRRVYDGDIERVDLMAGMFAERRPQGFGFSETAFRIFALMAPRRLKSDRFFTVDYTPRVYTPAGMEWIERNDMASVLLRHFPELAPALRRVRNAFQPWLRTGG